MAVTTKKQRRDKLFTILGVKDRLTEYPVLAKWATTYVSAAEEAGEDVELNNYSEGDESLVAGTIKLVCDLWPYELDPFWLSWQCYGGPRLRGPKWVARFQMPTRWSGGVMYLGNPWDFAFSRLLMASEEPTVQFEFETPRRVPLSQAKNAWLAQAVLDGVRFDNNDAEFGLICQKRTRSLYVGIFPRWAFADFLVGNADLKPKKDVNGIHWFGQVPASNALKPNLKKRR